MIARVLPQLSRSYRTALVLIGSVSVLAGCSGGGSPVAPVSGPHSAGAAQQASALRAPVADPFAAENFEYAAATPGVYVTDLLGGTITEYKTTSPHTVLTKITGLARPQGISVAQGLYASDNGNVLFYKLGQKNPSLTLLDGSAQTTDIAVGTDGTVYVANYIRSYDAGGDVAVYAKGQTLPAYAIVESSYKYVESVALDSKNNLYVGFVGVKGSGHIYKYAPGKMTGKDTGFKITQPWGMAFDASGDLVAADATVVDVFAPGHAAPIKTFGKLTAARYLAFNSTRSTLYVADNGTGKVNVYSYPAGALTGSITAKNASGVALYPPAPL